MLTLKTPVGVASIGGLYEDEAHFVKSPVSGTILEHKEPFQITQDLIVATDAPLGEAVLTFDLRLQVCNANTCSIGTQQFAVPFVIVPTLDDAIPAPTPKMPVRGGDATPKVVPIPGGADDPRDPNANRAEPPQTGALSGSSSIWILIVSTMGYALVMLFTPCVFPMIPVTVSFFLHQAEKKHGSAVPLALVYSGTIVGLLTLAVLSFGSVIIALASHPWLNLAFVRCS